MKSIATVCQIPDSRICDGDWGVEIEVEGRNLPEEPTKLWRIDQDGSLRGESAEYVLKKPLPIEGVRKALDELEDMYQAEGSEVVESVRAGVHVHMNVQSWNMKQLFTFITNYFMLEELLVRWCGEDREGNLFCLRAQDAEYVLFCLYDAVSQRDLSFMNNENIRYASLNVSSLFKYGSVEFRSMRGTRDLDAIYEWVEILQELRDNSLLFHDPIDAVLSMSGEGEDIYLRRMFPTKWEKLAVDGYEKIIRKACRRIQMLAFTLDWSTISRPSNNPFRQDAF